MTSSISNNKNPSFSSIKFTDGTSLSSASTLNYDTRITKKLKVENDATFNKNMTIKGDLIVEGSTSVTVEGFVTDEELATTISNYETSTDKSRYLLAYAPNTLNSNTYPITGLSSNSSLLIGSTNNLLVKNGAVTGKYLKCIDNNGLVGWGDVGSSTTTITDVTTNYGPITNTQTQYSFKIVDIGTTGLSTPRGVFYYPNVQSDYITNAGTSWQQQSIVLALGTGTRDYIQTNDNNIPRIYICPFGKGSEALFFKPPLSNDPTSGQTRLTGGAQNETDQFISLESSGIKIKPKNNPHSAGCVLTSTSNDGQCSWQTITSSIPSNLNINSITTNTSEIINSQSTKEGGYLLAQTFNTSFTDVDNSSYYYLSNSGYQLNPDPNLLIRDKEYLFTSPFINVSQFNLPANYDTYQIINIPIHIRHRFNFKSDRKDTDDGNKRRVNFWFKIDNIQYRIINSSGSQLLIGIIEKEINTVVMGVKRDGTAELNDNTFDLDSTFYYDTLKLHFAPPSYSSALSNLTLQISFNFKFSYSGCDIRLHNGDNNVWIPHQIIINRLSQVIDTRSQSVGDPFTRPLQYTIYNGSTNVTNLKYNCYDEIKWSTEWLYRTDSGSNPHYVGNLNAPTYIYPGILTSPYLSPKLYQNELSTKFKIQSFDNVLINNLMVKNNFICHQGVIGSCGYYCRPGYPSTNNFGSTVGSNLNQTNSTQSFSSYQGDIFNVNWTSYHDSLGIDFWINSTKVLRLAPNFSDYRIKNNVSIVDSVLNKIVEVPIIKYDIENENIHQKSKNHLGIFAHELQEKFQDLPHLVTGIKDGTELQSINYNELTILLMKSIQELKSEIDYLKSKLI